MRINIKALKRLISEAMGNAYETLGVEPGASPFEIRQAWRKLALQARAQRKMGDPWSYAQIEDVNAAKDALMAHPEDPSYEGYENPDTLGPPAPAAPKGPGIPRGSKESYKIYAPWREKRAVVRVGGKVYGTGPGGKLANGEQTAFKGNDRARVAPTASGKMSINATDSDHSQEWDPIDQNEEMETDMDEARRIIDALVIDELVRLGR